MEMRGDLVVAGAGDLAGPARPGRGYPDQVARLVGQGEKQQAMALVLEQNPYSQPESFLRLSAPVRRRVRVRVTSGWWIFNGQVGAALRLSAWSAVCDGGRAAGGGAGSRSSGAWCAATRSPESVTAHSRLGRQGAHRGEGVEAVARQLVGRDVLAEVAGPYTFGQQVPDHGVEPLLDLGDVVVPVKERGQSAAVVILASRARRGRRRPVPP